MKKFNNFGFTLIELMLTLAIAGLLASMAVPSFGKMIERNRLKEAAESLKSDFVFARSEAIKRSQDVVVSRKTGDDGSWCYGLTTNDSCDCAASPSTCEIKTVSGAVYSETNIKSVFPNATPSNTAFEFRRGTAATGNTCFSTTHYTVKVKTSNIGRVTMCTNDNSTAVPGVNHCPNSDSVCAL